MKSSKGIMFTMDVFFSVVIVIGILFLAMFSMTRTGESSWTKLRLAQMANDFIVVMDYNKTMDDFDVNKVEDFYNLMMPVNINMSINVSCWESDGNRVTWSGEKEFEFRKVNFEQYIMGRRGFVTDDSLYCYADYRAWYS